MSVSFIDNVTLIQGRHTFKAGVDVRRNQIDISQGDSFTVNYASRDALIANSVDSLSFAGAFAPRIVRTDGYFGYVLDEWKVTPNVTLNAGLRYEYYTPLHERDGRQRIYDRPACGGICPAGSVTYFADKNNFGPRLSLAWAPAKLEGRTTIRVGAGIYHQQGQLDDLLGPIESDNRRGSSSAGDPMLHTRACVSPFALLLVVTTLLPSFVNATEKIPVPSSIVGPRGIPVSMSHSCAIGPAVMTVRPSE